MHKRVNQVTIKSIVEIFPKYNYKTLSYRTKWHAINNESL